MNDVLKDAEDSVQPLASGDTALFYRAAIGVRGQGYHLPRFLRFDAAGHAGLGWNWMASLFTLNWLIYRKMWGYALAYIGMIAGACLVIFGVGKLVFDYSSALAWVLGLWLLVVAFVVPGLYANAWLYNHYNDRISDVLRKSSGVADAISQLTAVAPGARRLEKQLAMNAVLLMALLAPVLALQNWQGMMGNRTAGMALASSVPEVTAQTPVSAPAPAPSLTPLSPSPSASPTPALSQVLPSAAASAAPAASFAANAPAPAPLNAPAPSPAPPRPPSDVAASRDLVPKTDLVPLETVAPLAAPSVASPLVAQQPAPSYPARPVKPKRVVVAQADTNTGTTTAPPPASAHPSARLKAASQAAVAKRAQMGMGATGKAAPKTMVASATAPASPLNNGWRVQVGVFRQADNAQRVLSQVRALGIAVGTDTLINASGERLLRVMAGPFAQKMEAGQAAQRIQAQNLAAVLVPPSR
jgi:cell division septation protein DedD